MTVGRFLHHAPRLGLPLFCALVLACASENREAYEDGYREGYAAGYAEGAPEGERLGADGGSLGRKSSAARGRREGALDHVYLAPAFWSFLVGIGIGLVCQYIVLFDAKDNGRVPSLVQTGLVPGMTSTFSYQLLERRWRLLARLDDWLARLARRQNARIEEIRTVRAVMAARINAASDLEELVGRKYVALASKELTRIVSEAENEHRSPPPGDRPSAPD